MTLPVVDGKPVALTGELVVETPVETASAVVAETDCSVGAHLWRTRFPNNTNSNFTIEDWDRQHWHTFASGGGRI